MFKYIYYKLHPYILCLAAASLLYSCGGEAATQEQAIARVFEEQLYPKDLEGIGEGLSEKDSLYQTQLYIEKWIQDQLLLKTAEKNIPKSKRIERLVQEYRASLILDYYEQALLEEQMDSVVTGQQITTYYNQNLEQYQLGISWVRCHFLRLPRTAPQLNEIRGWFKSGNGIDFEKIKMYCAQNKDQVSFILDEDKWIELSKIEQALPADAISERYLSGKSVLDKTDDKYAYFFKSFEYRDKEDAAPLSQVKDEISKILLHQRERQLLQNIRKEIYEKGKSNGDFEIFNN